MSKPASNWATKCAEVWNASSHRLSDGEALAALIDSHAEAHVRARERAVVEECGRIIHDRYGSGPSYLTDAIRERYAEILREEGKP